MPLYVAFVWHMHQPYYKDPISGKYVLPWLRLHAVKDYLHMVEVLSQYPRVKVTINLVPSLLLQLLEYLKGEAIDPAMELGFKDEWSQEEKEYILSHFFSINRERLLNLYPPYRLLLELSPYVRQAPHLFSSAYFRDLITWFNLAWTDPNKVKGDAFLKSLAEKGVNFSREEFAGLLEKHREIMAGIIPLYRELEAKGQVELATSPFYHPILPLLINIENARRASPHLPLPSVAFSHPEDAEEQIRKAIEFHRNLFGHEPAGFWPPEGAVCPELVPILAQKGFAWFATDEAILARTLQLSLERDSNGHLKRPEILYKPYRIQVDGKSLAVLFRDRFLSDRIGFVYQHMDGYEAAQDLVGRLKAAKDRLPRERPSLVTIILDGENCWEHYEHNGDVFLHNLYRMLSEEPEIECVRVKDFLEMFPPQDTLTDLATGSWIEGNLETWIGEEAQNRAWEALARVREDLINWQKNYPLADLETLEKGWECLYRAEGSDWFWWYYSQNVSEQEQIFDQAFRGHLAGVYTNLGLPVPEWLSSPITRPKVVPERIPSYFVSPRLEASPQASSDWARAGYVKGVATGGAMRPSSHLLSGLYYGYDPGTLYLRIETGEPVDSLSLSLYFICPSAEKMNWQFRRLDEKVEAMDGVGLAWALEIVPYEPRAFLFKAEGQEVWRLAREIVNLARSEKVLELAIPLSYLGLKTGDTLGLIVVGEKEGVLEKIPYSGPLLFTIKDKF
ncbi:MAG: glycoside hydrolase family 57 protein [Anaerolineae bacterium]|nr:glycoside hydrolase family 57 protein [Anaerolineae bacterium]MDW8103084.1 glycoside hydrolase family 57 protein [Anaerolineae bacterium]